MEIKLIAFGIAKDILEGSSIDYNIDPKSSIGDLKKKIVASYPDFKKLQSLKFAINEDYQNDNYELQTNDEVVIIPPVSGG